MLCHDYEYNEQEFSIRFMNRITYHRIPTLQKWEEYAWWNLPFNLGNGRVPAYAHNRLALDHSFATQPDSHSTISIIAWYLTLKNWNFSVYTRISTRNLTIFEPTRPDLTRPFDTRSDSYSTNLPIAHSLTWNEDFLQFLH